VNLLGDNISTIKKNTETLIHSSKVVGLEVNTEKTKYTLLSRHQNAGQNHDIKIVNRCFGNVEQFRYLGMTITNQTMIPEEIKKRFNSGNASYHSVQNLLYSRLLSNNVKFKAYKAIILPMVLYECETLSLALREVHRLRVFDNRVLRRIFGLKRDKMTGGWRKLHNEDLHKLYSSQRIIGMM
jgi:hypothetical protein